MSWWYNLFVAESKAKLLLQSPGGQKLMIRRADGTMAQVMVFKQPNKNLQNLTPSKPGSTSTNNTVTVTNTTGTPIKKPVTITIDSPSKSLSSFVYSGEPSVSIAAEPRKTVQVSVPNLDGQADDAQDADETATTLSTVAKSSSKRKPGEY